MDVALTAGSTWTDPACPVARTVDLVGDRWSLLIIRDAMDGATTFTDFRQRLGIARNILADRLRKLVEHGILGKNAAADGRSHAYRLTEAGQDLFAAVVALRQWGERHAFAPGEPHSTLVDADGRELPKLRPLGQDGRPLTAETSHVLKTGRSLSIVATVLLTTARCPSVVRGGSLPVDVVDLEQVGHE